MENGLSTGDLALMRDNDGIGGNGFFWVFALLILMFGGNGWMGGGNNVSEQMNQGFTNQQLQNIALSSANNNYETAQLVNQQTNALMQQNNTNLINAIQGFNQVGLQIMNQTNTLGSKLDQLGYQMENCCCSIKTLIKDNQIADLTNQLNNANNVAVNAAQTQTILNTMGKWIANAPATTA